MALDGAMLSLIRRELADKAVDTYVDKIHMPSREEVVLVLRGRGGGLRLMLSAKVSGPRAGFIRQGPENPKQPPAFCMLLRKYIGASKLIGLRQHELERILFFDFAASDDFGDPVTLTLALEMMGRHSNLVLVAGDGRILDAARRVDASASSVRMLLPGLRYALPPPRGRFLLTRDNPAAIAEAAAEAGRDRPLSEALAELLQGVSPMLAREIAFESTGDTDAPCSALTAAHRERLTASLAALAALLREGVGSPAMLTEPGGRLRDVVFRPIRQYGARVELTPCESYSDMLERFYAERDAADRAKQRAGDLLRLLTARRDRVARRVAAQAREVAESLGRDSLRFTGDILSANLFAVKPGMTEITLENFYDPDHAPLVIALDAKLTPAQNATRYYDAYRKADTSHKKLTELVAAGELELAYLDSVLESLTRARTEEDYALIRRELAEAGILKSRAAPAKQQKSRLRPLTYRSSDGFVILAGRNNLENEAVTFKLATKQDIWFHAQKVPGAHTVVLTDGKQPPDRTLEEAAVIAATHSRFRDASKVPVDYTRVRFVKKIRGAGPGMVIYDPYETAVVDPDAALAERLAEP